MLKTRSQDRSRQQEGDQPGAWARRPGLLRRLLPWLLRSLGLGVLLLLAFVGVDVVGGVELMVHADFVYLLPAFAVLCGSLAMRMSAWIVLARSLKLGYRRLWSYARLYLIGWSVGLGLPQGAAPLARVAVLASDKRSVARGVTADVADRLVQICVLLLMLVPSAAYLSAVSTKALLAVAIAIGVVAAVVPLALLGALLLRPLWQRALEWPWVTKAVQETRTAVKELRATPRLALARVAGLQFVANLLTVTSLFLASRSLDVGLSYMALLAAFCVIGLTLTLPISINGLGPREGILTAAVAGAGYSSEAGVAIGLLWFAMQAVTRILAGAAWFISPDEAAEPRPVTAPATEAE